MNSRVFIVDDDNEMLGNYEDVLVDAGYLVSAYNESNIAIESFSVGMYDLVILDISMHGDRHAGFRLCKKIREIDKLVPIVMNTALADSKNQELAHMSGADDFWNKKASLDNFISNIMHVIKVNGG